MLQTSARLLFDQDFEAYIQANLKDLLSSDEFKTFNLDENSIVLIEKLFRSSEFAMANCLKYPETVIALLQDNELLRAYNSNEYLARLQEYVPPTESEELFSQTMREFRNQEMLRLAWRDIVCQVDLEITLRELSWLADACIQIGVGMLEEWQNREVGIPLDSTGEPIKLVVLAMGKLGAHELNYSSDIDLIFTYKEDGVIKDNPKQLTHREYFIRLCQRFVKLLSDNTAYGFVFRVDTRLRPFGDSGQLALSFDAMELYYERHGREWERYAMIKARAISADHSSAEEIMQRLKPFVYRRYLDYGAFASLREMKELINKEVQRKGVERDVKLGPGGIREIEFIGQAFQLIRGGHVAQLQIRPILSVLDLLRDLDLLPEYVVSSLKESYVFLRKTENAIQAFADQQTHLIPTDPLVQKRLAYAMDYSSWTEFQDTLDICMSSVQEHFEQTFSAPQLDALDGKGDSQQDIFSDIWLGIIVDDEAEAVLQEAGYPSGRSAYHLIITLRKSSAYRRMGPKGKKRLDALLPLLVSAVSKTSDPNECLLRIMRLIDSIAKRTAYLALLAENPMGLSQLVKLFDCSPWIVEMLISHPMLLDELLDPRRLYEPMSKEELEVELKSQLNHGCEEIEQQMLCLIAFKQSNVLRVAAAELTGAMPVENVSDHLTYIAEIVLDAVCHFAWEYLEERHGKPQYIVENVLCDAQFCVIAYGKLGSYELGFGSDLDLVFLHDSQGEKQLTNGRKQIDNAIFFARLGQRIIHFLNTSTQVGVLYEVDSRLRPSGSAGMLVSSLKSFADYQQKKAWTWEHQALIRARAVFGEAHLSEQFNQIRQQIITSNRDAEKLRKDVSNMRARMRSELLRPRTGQFDLKQGVGGIADIEFITQYLVLSCAGKYPELIEFTDNLQLLETLAKNGVLQDDDAKILCSAYLAYRHAVHEFVLQQNTAVKVSDSVFHEYREGVTRIWNDIMER